VFGLAAFHTLTARRFAKGEFMAGRWIAARTEEIELSGVRRIFELGRSLRDPIDLSIGQPHFPVPDPIKAAAINAINTDRNGYTVTQGIPALRDALLTQLEPRGLNVGREVMVTSGTSGGLFLALAAILDPGDEVVLFDPYFVSYPHLVTLLGGRAVFADTYPDFLPTPERVRPLLSPRTKAVIVASPANPTGVVPPADVLRDLAALCRQHGVLLISDEIYRGFCFDGPPVSPADFDPDVLVVDGFGKTYGFTGWRLGFAHGPSHLIAVMSKLQQFTFVCAPSIVQHAGLAALAFDTSALCADYAHKRDQMCARLQPHYTLTRPGGAFYLFPQVPHGSATDFVTQAIAHNLLIIPGSAFSRRDTHFRISFAASTATLERGLAVLELLAQRR
jgi:aspartate aminotransferase/aminotransferase